MSHFLFVSYGGGHIAMLLPVAIQAREMGNRVTVLALTTAALDVKAAGLDCIGFNDLWAFAADDARGYGDILCQDNDHQGPVSMAETKAYHGINFSELVAEVGENEAYSQFDTHGRHAFSPVNFMMRVFQHIQPDVVIASNSPRSERAAVLAARALSIPAICVNDLFALKEYKWIAEDGYADKVCVLNEDVKRFLVSHGRTANDIVVTGNPAFDSINQPETISAGNQLKCEREWNDGKINILWASQVEPLLHPFENIEGDPNLPSKIEKILREIVAEHDNARLIVRYHPSEKVSFIPGVNVDFSPRSEPLHALLHAVDMVIVTGSTVGLEAYIAGLPVVSVDMSIFTVDAPFSAMGISTGVRTLHELRQFMHDCLNDHQKCLALLHKPERVFSRSATEAVLGVIQDVTN